jgi:DNA methylase
VTKKITDFMPQRQNANTHTPRGMDELERSIQSDGWIGAITVAADGETFDGSARIEVSAGVGLEDAIVVETDGSKPVVVRRTDIPTANDPRAKRLGIAANRIAELNLSWEPAVLDSLIADGIDLSTLFREGELPIAVEEPAAQPGDDDAPTIDLDRPTRCQPGDVWRVGPHTVCCLDSRDRAMVEQCARGVTFVVADPPYGIGAVNKDGRSATDKRPYPLGGAKGTGKPIAKGVYMPVIGDDSTDTAIEAALLSLELCPKAIQFWWGANNYANALPPSTCWIVWSKETNGNLADAELAWSNHEGAVRLFTHMWNGMLRDSEHGARAHPTQKPVALFLWLYVRYGKAGDVIFDPFLGSGPSLKAAHRMGDRTVVGFELAPAYCDHILEWAESNGLTCERLEA